ncbi:hypothetical protein EDC04DRAFT_2897339 [Pisolithus marmoratus]|nr:hypothetical protein EDC04DRAFT_2897339 [Pisolithus marmoratus]
MTLSQVYLHNCHGAPIALPGLQRIRTQVYLLVVQNHAVVSLVSGPPIPPYPHASTKAVPSHATDNTQVRTRPCSVPSGSKRNLSLAETCPNKIPSQKADGPASPSSTPAAEVDLCPTEPSDSLDDPPTLRPLTSLKWPYVPDDSTHDDPLKRDDPKPLTLHQYEAIATSPAIRTLLATNPRLKTFLTSIDKLRGAEREEALQRALGIDSKQGHETDEDIKTFRRLAEAVETAVRGGRNDVLGLDWDDKL